MLVYLPISEYSACIVIIDSLFEAVVEHINRIFMVFPDTAPPLPDLPLEITDNEQLQQNVFLSFTRTFFSYIGTLQCRLTVNYCLNQANHYVLTIIPYKHTYLDAVQISLAWLTKRLSSANDN